jgi:hypothetical protein
MVEVEAHTSNLTQRIKQLLNVPESEIESDDAQPNEANDTTINQDEINSNNSDKEMGMINSNGSK